jgi:asparagine synthase (glutamine-hydrolysing)
MDELLAGYDTYRASRMAAHFRRMPVWLRQHMIQPCMRAIPVSDKKYNWPALMRRFVGGASLPFPYDHASWRRMVDASWRLRLCSEDFLRERKVDPLQAYAQALDDIPDWLTPLEKQLHMDFRFHLPNDMLVKVDRASMAHSLEVRVPLLDREVIATCLSIPQEHKLRGKQGKWPLRQLLARDFPAQFIHRRKAGFVLPIENWLRGPWRDLTHQFLTPEWCSEVGWLNSHALQTMIQQHMSRASDHGYALMTLLVFSLWWRLWIAGSLERPRTHSPVLQSASPTRIMDSTNLSPA